MEMAFIVLAIIGAAFMGLGGLCFLIFSAVGGMGVFSMIPLFFVLLGACFFGAFVLHKKKQADILNKGNRYTGKIFGYVKDKSVAVNGAYPINIKVRYFDEKNTVKECIIPTGFPEGSNQYAIGMTIDIFEYRGKYGWDKASVRDEYISGQDVLMDNKPVEPEKLDLIAVTCPNCGSSFQATKGYANRCPYCDSYINV